MCWCWTRRKERTPAWLPLSQPPCDGDKRPPQFSRLLLSLWFFPVCVTSPRSPPATPPHSVHHQDAQIGEGFKCVQVRADVAAMFKSPSRNRLCFEFFALCRKSTSGYILVTCTLPLQKFRHIFSLSGSRSSLKTLLKASANDCMELWNYIGKKIKSVN